MVFVNENNIIISQKKVPVNQLHQLQNAQYHHYKCGHSLDYPVIKTDGHQGCGQV